jgi:hypothetical protein
VKTRERSAAGGGSGRQSVPGASLGAPLGGERLPTAPRERKPALAALAVLLILVGALGATLMVMRAGDKISAVEIVSPVAAGEQIPATAIREVMVSDVSKEDSNVTLIKWANRVDLLKHYRAKTNLEAYSVLTLSMIVQGSEMLPADKSIVGLSLKEGQFPRGLANGDTVAAYRVGSDAEKSQQGGGTGTGGGTTGPTSTLINDHLVVRSNDAAAGSINSGDLSVTVLVDTTDAGKLTIAAAANEVALVLVSHHGE